MLEALISHSPDLQHLQEEGFVMEACDGYLIIHHMPYINTRHELKDGTLIMPLCTTGDRAIRPSDHTAHWIGERPCDINGAPLPSLVNPTGRQII